MTTELIGLSERDAFALSLLLKKSFSSLTAPAPATSVSKHADLVVLDVDGCHPQASPASWSATLPPDVPAVVILPLGLPADQMAVHMTSCRVHGWVALRKPYRAESMERALRQALESRPRARAPIPPPAHQPRTRTAHGSASRRSAPTSVNTKAKAPPPLAHTPLPDVDLPKESCFMTSALGFVTGHTQEPPSALPIAPPPAIGAGSLGIEAFGLCGLSAPNPQNKRFNEQFMHWLSAGHPFEINLTLINGLHVHPTEGWVGSNTPLSVLRIVCNSEALQHTVRWSNNRHAQPLAQALKRGMNIYPLAHFLYALATLTCCTIPAAHG